MTVDPNDVCDLIGIDYHTLDFSHQNQDEIERAYRTMARINDNLFSQIPVPVEFTDNDPYDDYTDMKESVESTGVFKVFAGGSGTKYLSHKENCKGRAVHDWYGHLEADCNFTFEGECKKWYHVCKEAAYYPEWCHKVLFAEVVGQVALCHHLENGFADDDFRQRSIKAPDYWVNDVMNHVLTE
jgi:hypothetical protein